MRWNLSRHEFPLGMMRQHKQSSRKSWDFKWYLLTFPNASLELMTQPNEFSKFRIESVDLRPGSSTSEHQLIEAMENRLDLQRNNFLVFLISIARWDWKNTLELPAKKMRSLKNDFRIFLHFILFNYFASYKNNNNNLWASASISSFPLQWFLMFYWKITF